MLRARQAARASACLALLAGLVVTGRPARASDTDPAPTVVAGPDAATVGAYAPPATVLPRGGGLSFTNLDLIRHTLTSDALQPDGYTPVFNVGVNPAQRAEVPGVGSLPPGVYPFHCSLHPNLRGTLAVLDTTG